MDQNHDVNIVNSNSFIPDKSKEDKKLSRIDINNTVIDLASNSNSASKKLADEPKCDKLETVPVSGNTNLSKKEVITVFPSKEFRINSLNTQVSKKVEKLKNHRRLQQQSQDHTVLEFQ